MSIYRIKRNQLEALKETKFDLEKDLQQLIEMNLETVFGLEFLACEISVEKRRE